MQSPRETCRSDPGGTLTFSQGRLHDTLSPHLKLGSYPSHTTGWTQTPW